MFAKWFLTKRCSTTSFCWTPFGQLTFRRKTAWIGIFQQNKGWAKDECYCCAHQTLSIRSAKCQSAKLLSTKSCSPGVDLIKRFCAISITLFCKLDHCINVTIIVLSCEKISFQNSMSKFIQKSFITLTSWCISTTLNFLHN